ncbi:PREDICTED: heparan-sulfate 6-O-sulfotransferase 1-like, partial [Rhagoletis zephyria]|uniref:heparan-sulfate 6-O-sulfotransferase 1-like n=1 Tax=Rhagoletis zephyria TaxID=28612 RepID=UPI0008116D54
LSYSSSSQQSESDDVDHILGRTFGFSFDRYQYFQLAKTWQVNFGEILASPKKSSFHIKGNDVMVFLHMQKTGGSAFDRHLVRDLILEQPCKCEPKRKKKCRCFRPDTNNRYWLFSRYSIGWKCGLHADYTELINCVDRVLNQVEHIGVKRRYFYVTLLRDPIARFVSEFKHVQRGATWKSSRHWCGGRLPTPQELPQCYTGSNWGNVSLSEFMSCRHNLAFNRQTRMLADLSLVGCYNQSVMSSSERDLVMLNSAKRNLRQMAFFGLCEEQIASQYLFERTFNQKFKRAFVQFNSTRSRATLHALSSDEIKQIHKLNHLDVKLYAFAHELFRERFSTVKSVDADFERNFESLLQKSLHQPKRVSTTTPKTKRANGLEPSNKDQSSVLVPEEEEDDTADDQSNDIVYDDGTHVHDSVEDYYSNRIDDSDQ